MLQALPDDHLGATLPPLDEGLFSDKKQKRPSKERLPMFREGGSVVGSSVEEEGQLFGGAGGEVGPLEVASSILQESGPSGFFVGVGSRAFYWAPAIGIFLSLYCSLRQTAFNLGL